MLYSLAAAMGVAVGLTLGFFGSGGSILTVPLLTYGLGIEAKSAVAMSLVIVGGTALTGFLQQWRQGKSCVRAGLMFGGFGFAGAFAGARVSAYLTGTQQLALFAVVMFSAAARMLWASRDKDENLSETSGGAGALRWRTAAFLGTVVGYLTGLLGVGGGFLIVPALVAGGLDVHRAVGTSLLVIIMNCVAGIAGHWGRSDFQPKVIAAFLVSSTAASVIGAKAGQKVPAAGLKRVFALFLLAVAAFVLYKNREAFFL